MFLYGQHSIDYSYRNYVAVEEYGAKADGKVVANLSTTSGSGVVTSSVDLFTDADLGKLLSVNDAGLDAARVAYLIGTITTVTSSTSVTIDVVASATVAGETGYMGTDNSAFIQSAVTASTAAKNKLLFSGGTYLMKNDGDDTMVSMPSNSNIIGAGKGCYYI